MPVNYRILYFSSQFPTLRNPTRGAFSLQRVQALHRAGCEVVVVSPLDITALLTRPGQVYRWIKRQAHQPFESEVQGIPSYYPKWICPPKRIIGWYSSFFMFLQIRNAVIQLATVFRPDVILTSWLPDAVAASMVGNLIKVPVLAIADGTDVNLWIEKYRAWNYARDILNEKTAFIIFVSEALRAAGTSRGLYGRKNTVLHNAVDVHLFSPNTFIRNNGEFTVLGVGRFIPTKGFHILLEAFAKFSKLLNQQARLVLVGDGPQHEALLQRAADLDIHSSVEMVGFIDQEKLVKYYQEADVFCLPSFSEGFPCVVVEAMACGKPVVASRVGGIAEVVDAQSGILVAPGDADTLCDALLHAQKRTWDGEIIRKKILEGFGWDKWVETILKLIDDATNEKQMIY
jgi:teichuronic acid biosynthesis glycosyltransferase TuaC